MTSKLVSHCNTMWFPQYFVIFHGMKKKILISVNYFPKLAMIENQFKNLLLQKNSMKYPFDWIVSQVDITDVQQFFLNFFVWSWNLIPLVLLQK